MADEMSNGFMRDEEGNLVVVLAADAVAPVTMVNGFMRDADGALVVANGASA